MSEFGEKALAGLTNAVSGLGDSLMFLLRKTRIKRQMKDTQFKKMQMLRNLGELVYGLQMNGTIDIEECGTMCDKITSFNEKIKELQNAVRAIEDEKITPQTDENGQYDMAVCTDKSEENEPTSAEM